MLSPIHSVLDAQASTPLAGRYEIKRKLAEGGMAEIFLARQVGDHGFERLVVIKRILPGMTGDADFKQMLTNEARILARLDHPNIVQVYELVTAESELFIVMELIQGEDLRNIRHRLRDRRSVVPIGLVCRIVAEVLAGLHYAHISRDSDGAPLHLVHRDVSPSNIIVTYEGGVKVVDFGIAKSSLNVTRAGQMKGKFSYMSPEQVQLLPIDARSDVFAAGIILWELLTGESLFKRATIEETVHAVVNDPVPSSWSFDQRVPKQLDQIVSKALARDLADRYASAEQMQHELERLIRDEHWEADRSAMRSFLRGLFDDKLSRQDADVRSAGRADVVELLLSTNDSTQIDWIGADRDEQTPSTAGAPARLGATATMVAVPAGDRPSARQVTEASDASDAGLRSNLASLQQVAPASGEIRAGVVLPFAPTVSTKRVRDPQGPTASTERVDDPHVASAAAPPAEAVTVIVAHGARALSVVEDEPAPTRAPVGAAAYFGGWPRLARITLFAAVATLIGGSGALAALRLRSRLERHAAVVEPAPVVAPPPPVTLTRSPSPAAPLPPAPPAAPGPRAVRAPSLGILRVKIAERATFQLDQQSPVTGQRVVFEATAGQPHRLQVRTRGHREIIDTPAIVAGQSVELNLGNPPRDANRTEGR